VQGAGNRPAAMAAETAVSGLDSIQPALCRRKSVYFPYVQPKISNVQGPAQQALLP
jgi:hypothetical protein